jgi:hypothetical protein
MKKGRRYNAIFKCRFRTSLLLLLRLQHSWGRTWKDIVIYHNISTAFDDLAPFNQQAPYEVESFAFSEDIRPTSNPTTSNIFAPPSHPSPTGTRPPSTMFSNPTHPPTTSTLDDTSRYTYPANAETPLRPPRGYFNYDTSSNASAMFGPGHPVMEYNQKDGFAVTYANNGWEQVLAPRPGDYYWDEFGPQGFGPWRDTLTDRQMRYNQCGNVGRQSPIDIRPSGVACVEHHQIRTRVRAQACLGTAAASSRQAHQIISILFHSQETFGSLEQQSRNRFCRTN